MQVEDRGYPVAKKQESLCGKHVRDEQMKNQLLKQQVIFDRQGRDLQVSSCLGLHLYLVV